MVTTESTTRLCNCSADANSKTNKAKPCKCGTTITKRIASAENNEDSENVIKKFCKCGFQSTKIKHVAKSSQSKIARPIKTQKIECGGKDVTNIYLPRGPIDFLKACFGPDDYPRPKDMVVQKHEAGYSRPSNLSGMEQELRSEILTETNDLNCPHISRKVLCDVKLKIRPGSKVETCSSYFGKKIENGTETKTSIKVNTNAVSVNTSEREILQKQKKRDSKSTYTSMSQASNKELDKDNICKECCLKNHCTDAGQTTEIKLEPENVVSVKFDCKCQNCACKSSSKMTMEECNDKTCKEFKKLINEMIALNGTKKEEEKFVAVTNFNEIKPEPADKVKSKEIIHYQSEAVQAICTCDAETQGYDMKYYISSLTREMFCKSTSCDKGCKKCSMINENSRNELVESFHETERELPTKPYPIAAIRESETNHGGSHSCAGARDCNNCEHCDAIWRLISTVEVATVATFIVCILFYLCYNKMFNIFNHTKCRHTFC